MTASLAANYNQDYSLKESCAVRVLNDEITAEMIDNCLDKATSEINGFFVLLEQKMQQMITAENFSGATAISCLTQLNFQAVLAERINSLFNPMLITRFGYVEASNQIVYSNDILPPANYFLAADGERRRTSCIQRLAAMLAEMSIEHAIENFFTGQMSRNICKRLNLAGALTRMLMDKAMQDNYLSETVIEIRGWLECARIAVLRQTKKQIVNTFYQLHDKCFG